MAKGSAAPARRRRAQGQERPGADPDPQRLQKPESSRARSPVVRGAGACHIKSRGIAEDARGHGSGSPAADLQPRQLRSRPSAPLPGDRAPSGRALQAPVGADPLGLADHRQLRLPVARRLRARAGRDQAAQRRVHVAQPASRHREDAGDPRARSSTTPPRSSSPTCSWSTRSRWACAARCARRLEMLQGARHALRPGPARRDGRAGEPASTNGSARWSFPALERALRRDLGLRPAARSSTRCARFPACRRVARQGDASPAISQRTVPERRRADGEHRAAERALHPGDARRRRRRRRS